MLGKNPGRILQEGSSGLEVGGRKSAVSSGFDYTQPPIERTQAPNHKICQVE